MNKTFLSILLLISALFAYPSTPREEIEANINRAGGGYLAYPVTVSVHTPAPKGYTPFYISHYGRHGSRYLISDKDYKWVYELFNIADKHNALTPLGESVKLRLDTIYELTYGRGGDLSKIGVKQQKDIAARMYKSFPEVFEGDAEIFARSTIVGRCILSMDAFCESLKENNPKLDITRESNDRNMIYLNYHSEESNLYTGDNGPWREGYLKFERRHTKPERLMKSLFSSPDFVENLVNPENLMWGLYWIAVDMQDIPTDISFYDIFTTDELYELWQVPNLRYYIKDGNFKGNMGLVLANASNLLNNIIDCADAAISGKGVNADLRFGHDGNLIPLAGLMHLDGCWESIGDVNNVMNIFQDYRISPMAANIQMIFFRNQANKKDDILVKFMLNEREISLPINPVSFPFYKWEDVKKYWKENCLKN